MTLSKKIIDRIGQRYGRWVVKSFSHISLNKGRNAYWNCICDCGNERSIFFGKSQSCGCLARELSAKRIKELHIKGDHLYFIQCEEYIKIGRANNVKDRLGQLQAMNPYEIKLVKVLENEGYREKEFHEKFKEKFHTGEWYRINSCEIVDIL